jgi:glucokinase
LIELLDGLVVIGGGLSNAYPLFIDSILKEMNGTIESYGGDKLPRMPQKSFDLENSDDQKLFLKGEVQTVKVLGTDKTIQLDSMKRIGIGRAVLDTSHAVSVGAYSFALNELDK